MNAFSVTTALLVISTSVASAETPRHTVIEIPLLALSSNALAVQGERPLRPRTSVAVGVGLRDGADGDYQSMSVGFDVEVRAWLLRSQHGLFVGPRLEMALTRVSATNPSRRLGTAIVLTEAAVIGYRFVIAGRVEVTPVVGFALRHDLVGGGVPNVDRTTPVYGVSAGWIFH